ncbi:CYTH domain-containing protein [Nitrosomonas cryotolerans]|uniref:CYTH domain-containing protein n=1 Tax=Nitrosomonas cryotolerans ATCC 49181 TaxID=1131553 RepID=A0A1N6GZ88_9PROT|nr:CYTH and CHAD domain-containing protein [Nitrosomonas cryotolerans]SFP87632.1 CYTH domain-containing protein [Nitrosomonas cryotolerans]SIO12829.1 CYTH domain-containing protein [Nitrosomonas cryotolerans ATCC 49181]
MIPTEIELKLRLSPKHVADLQCLPLLKSMSMTRPITQKLYSIYYDTPDLHLMHHGIALRLRRVGRHWIQTIKGGGSASAGLHQHNEWEARVSNEQPDFTKITDPNLIRLLSGPQLRKQLRPIFTTDFSRHTRLLQLNDGSQAEFSLDQGKISTDRKKSALCEIEIELKSGNSVQLLEFALVLSRAFPFPLRLENTNKAERGFALYSGQKRPPSKAQPLVMHPDTDLAAAFKEVLQNCLTHLNNNENGLLEDSNSEYLHQMRIALRRQQSALNQFSQALPKDRLLLAIAPELKWLTRQFNPARDWDVFCTQTLPMIHTGFPDHTGINKLKKSCLRLRHKHYKSAQHAVKSKRYLEIMLKLSLWLNSKQLSPQFRSGNPAASLHTSVIPFSNTLLTNQHQQLKKYGNSLTTLSTSSLHSFRISIKKQRYLTEFFITLYPGRESSQYLRSLHELQDILGVINDQAVIKQYLKKIKITRKTTTQSEAIGIILGWVAHQTLLQKPALNRAWISFNKTAPFWQKTTAGKRA